MTERTILHVDLDAFFASVEQRDRPELRGLPVVVGGGGGEDARGVVSAASYEARRFGIHSAMSLREAYRRCPEAIFLPVDGRRYQLASRDVMAILRRYTPLVEPISIDEAFLDVTASAALFGDGPAIARRIKDDTRAEVGLTASVGVATTKLVAKIASDLRKPDGLVVVLPGDEQTFLAPLAIGRLWGVGEKTAVALAEYGVRTIGDLAALPPDLVVRRFGKHGASLIERARGLDGDTVREGDPAKSVSHEHTFDVDTSDPDVIERTLLAMAEGVGGRLRSAGVKAGTIAVKIRDSGFHTITRQRTLTEPTDLTDPIYAAALDLARPELRGMKVRLLGVQASNLGEREQLSLFDTTDPRRRKAVEAEDALRRRYGERTVTRARLIGTGLPAPFERDPRNPLDRRARGRPASRDTGEPALRGMARVVTAKVTRTSTIFRPTTLDIEHLFGLVSGHNRTDVLSNECPGRHDPSAPGKEPSRMAFIRVEPVQVKVRTDWFSGRPREITWGDERLQITRLAVVRDEAAAYPVISGPRTLFEVDTPRARLSLTYQHRSGRWTVTGLDEEVRRRAA